MIFDIENGIIKTFNIHNNTIGPSLNIEIIPLTGAIVSCPVLFNIEHTGILLGVTYTGKGPKSFWENTKSSEELYKTLEHNLIVVDYARKGFNLYTLEEFCGNNFDSLKILEPFNQGVILYNLKKILNNPASYLRIYNSVTNNCHHFVNECLSNNLKIIGSYLFAGVIILAAGILLFR